MSRRRTICYILIKYKLNTNLSFKNKQNRTTKIRKTLWDIADNLRGAMNADDLGDYMLSFCSYVICQTIMKHPLKKNRQRLS